MQQQVQLQGIIYDDLQRLFEQVVAESKPHTPNLVYLDVAYLYTFDPSDIPFIGKFTDKMRTTQQGYRNPLQIEWHRYLERWYANQTVHLFNREIKPIKIVRTLDRVVNEFMERISSRNGWTG